MLNMEQRFGMEILWRFGQMFKEGGWILPKRRKREKQKNRKIHAIFEIDLKIVLCMNFFLGGRIVFPHWIFFSSSSFLLGCLYSILFHSRILHPERDGSLVWSITLQQAQECTNYTSTSNQNDFIIRDVNSTHGPITMNTGIRLESA